ncbi:MAG TPA: 4'-phosphopantetheinyl transferase superfamily protein [Ornithinibacter sp.]|nr:4'-phosphopantetheinyl transferase superfamily protein [Ornithinibacter sp.]
MRSLGLDAEVAAALPPGVLDVVASSRERTDIERLRSLDPPTPWDTVLFTAKEATYKAWHPVTGILLSHDDVEVRLSPDGRFTSVASAASRPGARGALHVRGRWALGPRAVVSLAVVE